MEAAAAGKLEGGYHNASTGPDDRGFSGLQVRRVQHNKWRVIWLSLSRFSAPESECESRNFRTGIDIVRPPVLEGPTENCGVKLLCPINAAGCEFDIIDLVMRSWIAHTSAPYWFAL